MIKQLPAERPLPNKQDILNRVLTDDNPQTVRKTWLIPVAAAASIALVAGAVLTIPKPAGQHEQGPAGQSQTQSTEQTDGLRAGLGESIDAGRLTPAQASEFGNACAKMIEATDPSTSPDRSPSTRPDGKAKVDAILHATLVRRAWDPKATDKTVVIKSGGKTYGCVGQLTKKRPDRSSTVGYDFSTFASPGKRGIHGTAGSGAGGAGGGTVVLDQKPDKIATDRWIEVGKEVATVRQRFVLKGKPGKWFSTKVVDGIAFIRAWDQATLNVGDKGQLETQLLDQSGQPLDYPSANGKTLVLSGTVTPHTPVLIPADKELGDILLR